MKLRHIQYIYNALINLIKAALPHLLLFVYYVRLILHVVVKTIRLLQYFIICTLYKTNFCLQFAYCCQPAL